MAGFTTYNSSVICLIVALGAYGYGFGFGVFVSSVGQPGFFRDMDMDPESEYTARSVEAALSSPLTDQLPESWGQPFLSLRLVPAWVQSARPGLLIGLDGRRH